MKIDVRCEPAGDGYTCLVTVGDASSTTSHRVQVRLADLDRWASGRSPEELVRQSFEFLLQREPKESILKEFDLAVIQRYFPDFSDAIRR